MAGCQKNKSSVSDRVAEHIIRHDMFHRGERVVLGFSGGPDSVALMNIIWDLKRREDFSCELVLAHMNHCLRGADADAEQKFCQEQAQKSGLEFVASSVSVHEHGRSGETVESAARRLRYEFLKRVAIEKKSTKIAVAHHADDVAETLLLRLMRGCGLYGLAAMPPVRPIEFGSDIRLIRPLLCVSKNDLLTYLDSIGARYCIDRSNFDLCYDRNFIRQKLMPKLQAGLNGALNDGLLALNFDACQLRDYFEDMVDVYSSAISHHAEGGGVSLDSKELVKIGKNLRIAIFRRAIQNVQHNRDKAPELSRDHWKCLDEMLFKNPGRSLTLPGKVLARREHSSIYIFKKARKAETHRIELPIPGSCGPVGEYDGIRASIEKGLETKGGLDAVKKKGRCIAYLNLRKLELPLFVRLRRPGDRFYPLGAPGERKLKDFFIDRKIPLRRRDRIPVVIDADNRIIWVAGEEIADFCKLKGPEEECLKLQVFIPD